VGGGIAFGRFGWKPAPVEPPKDVAVTVGEAPVLVNSAFMRRREDRFGGRIDELPLAVNARTMEPAAPPRPLGLRDNDSAPDTLHVTLLATDEKLAPGERTARLYLRHLKPESSPSVAGLLRRAFADSSPYGSEDLHFTPPAGGLFAARCLRAKETASQDLGGDKLGGDELGRHELGRDELAPDERGHAGRLVGLPAACVADLRVDGVDVRLRFPLPLLEDWERLTNATIKWVAGMAKAGADAAKIARENEGAAPELKPGLEKP
jgi:hypothetical protein